MAGQFTIFRSSDAGAPSLDGTVGSLVNLLDKCLVTGYGAKTAAGWSKPFTGTNKAVFRPGAGTRLYLRVQDDAPVTAKEARVTGYETMTAVDPVGTEASFPILAQGIGGATIYFICRKSATADATARTWILFADSRTFYLFVLTGDFADNYFALLFGDFYSFKSDDAFNCMLIARYGENSALHTDERTASITNSTAISIEAHVFARGHTQLGGSVQFGKHGDGVKAGGTLSTLGVVPFTNPEDGGIYLASIWVHDPTTIPVNGCRGRMRGLWHPCHAIGSFSDGDTFSGGASGELTGKTFQIVKLLQAGGTGQAMFAIETSATIETN